MVEAATQALAASLNLDPSAVAATNRIFFGWLVLMDVDVDGGWLLGDLGDSGLVSLGGKHFLGWLDGDVLVGFGLGFGVGRGVSVVFFFRWQAIFVGWMDVG